ncbi:MAG: methionyl-tRNA formyltransferase [Gammaproteobacteria bacterium]|nr:methionyl-tRNA formyltransferase [Gammaproteobacteria bacterium]
MADSFTPLRLVFAGTPEFAASHLQALIDSQHQLLAVYTQPDRPAGRGKKLTASPVKYLAQAASIPVCQPASLKQAEAQAALAELKPDAIVVVAYGLILPQAVLDIPRYGCINMHASLLPRWRGAAPIQRAIEAGDTASGVTIMQMDAGLDTGPTLATSVLPITANMNAGQLHDALIEVGTASLVSVLDCLQDQLANASTQDDALACYAHKIEKPEAELDWCLEARTLHRKILAFNPFPVAWTQLQQQRLKVWTGEMVTTATPGRAGEIIARDSSGITVACGEGSLRLTRLQLPGGKPLEVSQLLLARGELFATGERLGL